MTDPLPDDPERGVAVPPRKYGHLGPTKSELVREIQPGESRFFPAPSTSQRSKWQSIAATVGIADGRKFTTRTMMKDGKIGLRVWRTQ